MSARVVLTDGRSSYTFEAVDFFTSEPLMAGRLDFEQHGRRFVILARRSASTGGRWMATWCSDGSGEAEQLPLGLELSPALVGLLEQAPQIDGHELGIDDPARRRVRERVHADRRTEDAG